MEKIENCPFCGGMAVLKRIPDATYFPYYVRCSNVNCEMNVATCSRKTPEEAIKIWNHRPGEADAQPGWIPCSERLPDVRQWVLCQCRAGIMDVLRLTADGSWNKNYPHTEYMSGFVVAWMPLPTPWEGDVND